MSWLEVMGMCREARVSGFTELHKPPPSLTPNLHLFNRNKNRIKQEEKKKKKKRVTANS
jgi:hypothetical protein